VLGKAHALGQDDAQAIEKSGLSGIGFGQQRKRICPCVAVGNTTSCD
jgi:hypothetical protein